MHRINIKFNPLRTAGLVASGGLVALAVLTFSPALTMPRAVDALSCGSTECQEGYTSAYANMELGAAVASMVSVGLDNNVAIDITPKSGGAFASASAALTVSTNNETGFAVYMKSNNDGALVSSDSTSEEKIKSMVGSDFTSADNANAWGYSLDGTNYQAVPKSTSSTPIINESNIDITSGNNYNLTFGVKVDPSLPAGYYTGTVTVSAVANPLTISSLSQLVYMQDMTSEICANTAAYVDLEHYVTKQLIDTRDGNKYWVAKLADGNCWMTQNLALDITEAGLKASDTDISEDWNQSSQYPPMATAEVRTEPLTEVPGPTITGSYHVKDWVYGTPELRLWCQETNVDKCERRGFVRIDDTWRPTFTAQEGDWPRSIYQKPGNNVTEYEAGEYYGLIAVDFANKTYDPHYLLGNFYSYNAATAGSGGTNVSEAGKDNFSAPDSICPKNWKLPIAGPANNAVSGSFYYLLQQYGLTTRATGSGVGGEYHINGAPLYVVQGSAVESKGLMSDRMGEDSVLWSSTAYSDTEHAYYFVSVSAKPNDWTNANQWEPGARRANYNVRCLAR